MAAKGDASFVEQHVEKIVLGVCGLLLVFAFVRWVVSSPREVEVVTGMGLTAEKVSPDRADQNLTEVARRLRTRHETANVPVVPNLAWDDKFQIASRPGPLFPRMLDLGAIVPRITPPPGLDPNTMPSLEIVSGMIPPPGKPNLWVGFECPEPPFGKQPEDMIVCRGASVFPWGELRKRWTEKLLTLDVDMVVLGVEVEVQSRASSHQGWEGAPAEPANTVRLPPMDSQGRVVALPRVPDYDGTNAPDVSRAVDELRQNWQWYALTPPYFNVFHPRAGYVSWRINLPDNEVSKMDELGGLLLPPLTPGPTLPELRPPPPPYRPPGRPGMDLPFTEEEMMRPDFIPGRPGPAMPFPTPTPTPGPRPGPAARPMIEAPVPFDMKANSIPDLARQMEAGKVLAVFHDNALQLGRQYRYRVRLVLLNPLLTQDSLVRDPQIDARTTEVRSPWSPWSEEAVVEDPTMFFLTGSFSPDRAQVTVFTRKLGQTVMKPFVVRPGDAIGGPSRVPLSKPGEGPSVAEVDFTTGAVAIELDFDRRIMKGSPGGGQIAAQTTAMLYLTRNGEMRTRVQSADEQSEQYRRLLEEARASGR